MGRFFFDGHMRQDTIDITRIVTDFERDGFVLIEDCFDTALMGRLDRIIRRYYRAAPAGTPDDVTDVCVYRNMRYRFSTSAVVEERVAP